MNRWLKFSALACALALAVACTTVDAASPAPVIGAYSPAYVMVNPSGGKVVITGSNFKGNSIGLVNGSQRPLAVTSSTQATLTLAAGDTKQAGFLNIQIQNTKPVLLQSNSVQFQVCAPLQILTTSLPPAVAGQWYEVQLQATGGCL